MVAKDGHFRRPSLEKHSWHSPTHPPFQLPRPPLLLPATAGLVFLNSLQETKARVSLTFSSLTLALIFCSSLALTNVPAHTCTHTRSVLSLLPALPPALSK